MSSKNDVLTFRSDGRKKELILSDKAWIGAISKSAVVVLAAVLLLVLGVVGVLDFETVQAWFVALIHKR